MHQEKWQTELLMRYGNSNVLMDATYKTTKYEIPLFFISVKQMLVTVLWMILSFKKKQWNKLQALKSWNPDWKPPHFMTDAEIAAIELTFTNCKVFLRDFHREQAWEHWIKVVIMYYVSKYTIAMGSSLYGSRLSCSSEY